MSSVTNPSSASPGSATAPLKSFHRWVVLPVVGLLVVAAALLIGVILWSAGEQNAMALERQKRLANAALAIRIDQLRRLIIDYSLWDQAVARLVGEVDKVWADDNVGPWVHDQLGVDMSFVIDPDGRTIYAMMAGQRVDTDARAHLGADLDRLRGVAAAGGDEAPVVAGLMGTPGGGAAVVAVGMLTDIDAHRKPTETALVFVEALTEPKLNELGRLFLLEGLRFSAPDTAMHTAAIALRDLWGRRVGVLEWDRDRPGDRLVAQVLPVAVLVLGGIVLLGRFVLNQARHSVLALGESELRARRDPLTGLLNRRALDSELGALLAEGRRGADALALHYLDLDRFKPINDIHGHAVGDRVLCLLAERLRRLAREEDLLVRLGGDEFVIVQQTTRSRTAAEGLARRIVWAVTGRPFEVDGLELEVGISVGIAFAPHDAAEPAALLRCADQALYACKAAGGEDFRFFDEGEAPARDPGCDRMNA